MVLSSGPGFRECFTKAARSDETHDWSVHSVDYSIFKKRLAYFRDRRKRLKYMIKHAPQHTLPENVLDSIIGGKSHLNKPEYEIARGIESGYVPFVDSMSSDDHPPPVQKSARGNVVKRVNERTVGKRLSAAERNDVIMFLAVEIDKVVMFYMAQWQNLSKQIEDAGTSDPAILGEEILELLAFCTMNIVAVRQTLILYDVFARIHGSPPLLQWYMKKMVMTHKRTSFRKLLMHQELRCLIDIYRNEYGNVESFETQLTMFYGILESTERAESIASKGHVTLTDNCIQTLRDYFLLGMVEEQLGLQAESLTTRGLSLTPEMNQLAQWREEKRAVQPDAEPTQRLTCRQIWGLLLNLLSAFLYCMNYYIVEPSSTKYVNALGASDNFSGLLIGMMPIAALSSAIVFSIWTNHSFRAPLLTSGTCLIVGNVLYASALKHGSIVVALTGRFITGLGGPKCIVRRYMADTVPITLRTGVNAAFGMSIAVGSALGPASAIFVDQFYFTFKLPLLGIQYFNGMTGPGWFMATLWTVFTLIVFLTFGEPHRGGLEEQRRLEETFSQGALSQSVVSQDNMSQGVMSQEAILPPPPSADQSPPMTRKGKMDEDLQTVITNDDTVQSFGDQSVPGCVTMEPTRLHAFRARLKLITLPVRLCLFFLFCKTFCIEALVSATSALTKNRYNWQVIQVGTLGCINGLLVIPLSITVGWLSLYCQDRALMMFLVSIGCTGMFLLIDFTDLISTPHSNGYNDWNKFAVHPPRYVTGYFLAFCSIQSFEGVIGSTLSKVIPTALASGTLNSGLLATLVDTLGRAVGDLFIFLVGSINMRQLMNLLFIPAFCVLFTCLVIIRRNYGILAV